MRILLDECVDWRLLRDLAEHDAASFDIAIVVLRGRTTRFPDLRALLPLLHETT